MRKKRFGLFGALVAALLAGTLVLAACANPLHDSGGSKIDPGKLSLTYSALVTRGYMGGKALYAVAVNNPEQVMGGISHLSPGVVMAVRTGRVKVEQITLEYEDSMESGIFVEDPEAPISYGYIKITSVDTDSVTFAYQRFSNMGGIPFNPETFTVIKGEDGVDINHDGAPDISYDEMGESRPGIGEDSRYLNFISSQVAYNTTFFAVLPEQYPDSNYPGGLVGINPNGRWLVNKYKVKEGVEIHGTDTAGLVDEADGGLPSSISNGTPNNIQGLIHGDYVIDNYQGVYYSFDGKVNLSAAKKADTLDGNLTPLSGVEIGQTSGSVQPSVRFGGSVRPAVNQSDALAEASGFGPEDIPLYMDSSASDTAFVKFKEELLDVFPEDYNPDGKRYEPESAAIDQVVGFLNASIADRDLAGNLEVTDITLPEENAVQLVNRAMLLEKLREKRLNNYILAANLDAGDITSALPLSSIQITDNFDENFDPASLVEGEGIEEEILLPQSSYDRAAGRAVAASDYQNYLTRRNTAYDTFNKNFKEVLKLDVAKTLIGLINNKVTYASPNPFPDAQDKVRFLDCLNQIVTQVSLGLAGGGNNTWGNVEMTVGAAVFLRMEITLNVDITLANLLGGGDGVKLFEYNSVFQAGPVTLQIQCPINFNLDLGVKVESNQEYFAGYTGFYGGKATAGLNYGINYSRIKVWPWPAVYLDIPTGIYANGYARGESWTTTLAYFGPKTEHSSPVSITIQSTVTPKITVTPGVGVYGIVWGKLPAQVSAPLTARLQLNPNSVSIWGDLKFELRFQAGVGIKIWIIDFYKGLCDVSLYNASTRLFTINYGYGITATLKSNANRYLSANAAGGLTAAASAQSWEPQNLDGPGSKIAIKSSSGKYLSEKGNGTVAADASVVEDGQTWEVTSIPGGIALKSNNGKYLCGQSNGTITLADAYTAPGAIWTRTETVRRY
jgi:hypothetical protein